MSRTSVIRARDELTDNRGQLDFRVAARNGGHGSEENGSAHFRRRFEVAGLPFTALSVTSHGKAPSLPWDSRGFHALKR